MVDTNTTEDLDEAAAAPLAGSAAASRERRSRLIVSVATAFVSRISGFAVQLLVLPLVLAALGTGGYAAYVALLASFGWFGLFGLGIAVALPRFLSAAFVAKDHDAERQLVLTTTGILTFSGLLAACIMIVPTAFVAPVDLLHLPGALPRGEIATGFFVAALFVALRQSVSTVMAVRAGYQELFSIYLLTALANLLSIVMFVVALPAHSPLWIVIAYNYAPYILCMMANMAMLAWRRPYLVRGAWHPAATIRKLLPTSSNALLKQVCYFLTTSGATLVASHAVSVREVAAFGSFMAIMIQAQSALGGIVQPLYAAMANAHSHGDRGWFMRAYRRGLVLTLGISILGVAIGALAAPWLALHWLHRDLGITHLFGGAFAVFFLFWLQSEYHFNVMASMGTLRRMGPMYVLEGIAALLFGGLLATRFGIAGMAAGLALGMAVVMAFYIPSRALPAIRRHGWSTP
jgi:O-antigen/teichoic acid export membrane protein